MSQLCSYTDGHQPHVSPGLLARIISTLALSSIGHVSILTKPKYNKTIAHVTFQSLGLGLPR